MLDGEHVVALNAPPDDEVGYPLATVALLYAHHRTHVLYEPPIPTGVRVPRAEVTAIEPLNVSTMPPGLEQMLTVEKLTDLVAFASRSPIPSRQTQPPTPVVCRPGVFSRPGSRPSRLVAQHAKRMSNLSQNQHMACLLLTHRPYRPDVTGVN
jgi:hypothetical protein